MSDAQEEQPTNKQTIQSGKFRRLEVGDVLESFACLSPTATILDAAGLQPGAVLERCGIGDCLRPAIARKEANALPWIVRVLPWDRTYWTPVRVLKSSKGVAFEFLIVEDKIDLRKSNWRVIATGGD